MYFTYCIHTQTHTLSVLKRYPTKKSAIYSLQHDMKNFLQDFKDTSEMREITSSETLRTTKISDGFYFKKSDMFQDRYIIYEKKTHTLNGYIWNSTVPSVQKILIFSIFEDPIAPQVNIDQAALLKKSLRSIQVIRQSLIDKRLDDKGQDELIKELKDCLKARRKSIQDESV